jgi:hypothetical protein
LVHDWRSQQLTSDRDECRVPAGLEDVSKYVELFSALYASGKWSIEELKRLAGLNFLRVFKEVEKVGPALQPSEHVVEIFGVRFSGGQNDDFRPLTYTLGGRGMGCRDKYVTS